VLTDLRPGVLRRQEAEEKEEAASEGRAFVGTKLI
jgi:hypothetical protein